MKKLQDMKFGRLKPIEIDSYVFAEYRKDKKEKKVSLWICLCDCGKRCKVKRSYLIKGWTKSCGCLYSETRHDTKEGNRIEEGLAAFNQLYSNYRYRSKEKLKLEFLLNREEFKKLTKENCYYCGVTPNKSFKESKKKYSIYGDYVYNGVDRVDNNKGYTIENSVSCCDICNKAKRDLPITVFRGWINRIIKFNQTT